ncbi:DUF2459 domain-containing protein [Hymenobacter sp. 5516J-16]|nr:DUF2459 domain-containing protein [Hymenobacter sp. 5516J-16]UOQ76879.1 DUF2459 domain-containing protein [Hymenobacter sp. 5516J-16]
MHVDFYRAAPDSGARVVPLRISPEQYRTLAAYVQRSFRPDSLNHMQLRQPTGYSPEDFFFRARATTTPCAPATTGPTGAFGRPESGQR